MKHINDLNKILGYKISGKYEYQKYSNEEVKLLDEELVKSEIKLIKVFVNDNIKQPNDLRRLKDLISKLITINKRHSGFEYKAKLVNKVFDMYIKIGQ